MTNAVFEVAAFDPLLHRPEHGIKGLFNGIPYSAQIAIPDYGARVVKHYADVAPEGLDVACSQAGVPFDIPRFGLIINFDHMAEIAIHCGNMVLDESIRALVGQFGPVIFRNAYIAGPVRQRFHRNIFPHLRFHFDRGADAINQYSCFTRDPFDMEQKRPRASSTLFIANIVAWLETTRTGSGTPGQEHGVCANYDLFAGITAADLFGRIILEQPWDEPDGTGEIAVIDNRTVLHATYNKDGKTSGYPIGARYLV